MSASVMEPPALAGSPAGQQSGGHEPGRILAELSAALENPDIKALEVRAMPRLTCEQPLSPGAEHSIRLCVSLVQEQGTLTCTKIWGEGRHSKSTFLQRVAVSGAGPNYQEKKAPSYSQIFL